MSRILFPRIDLPTADSLWNQISDMSPEDFESWNYFYHEKQTFSATGGRNATEGDLAPIRNAVVAMASETGFPGDSSQQQKAEFDGRCSRLLYKSANIPIGEALRNSTWAYICLVLLPDVAKWRFPDLVRARAIGGVRNVFQRLWRRGFLMGHNINGEARYDYIGRLSEDAWVSIIERPGLSASPRLSRLIVEGWVKTADEIGDSRMEAVNRRAMKIIRSTLPVIMLDSLDDPDLSDLIYEAYAKAIHNPDLFTS